MADWSKATWDDIRPGNTVEVDGVMEQVVHRETNKKGELFLYLRNYGPVRVHADQQIEVFR
jgi:hypothetical protein